MTTMKKTVQLDPGEAKIVAFSFTPSQEKTYTVKADSLEGTIVATAPVTPAEFQVSDLTIEPQHVDVGQQVGIAVIVTNIGGTAGSYEVICEVT